MFSLQYEKVPRYVASFWLWIRYNKVKHFTTVEYSNFLSNIVIDNEMENNSIKELCDYIFKGEKVGKFVTSSKTNINYFTVYKDGVSSIPTEIYHFFKNIEINLIDGIPYFNFEDEKSFNFYKFIKMLPSLNKVIYHSGKGVVKSLIQEALEKKILVDVDQENKININLQEYNGSVGIASKQYFFNESDRNVEVLINSICYIDFYDLYSSGMGILEEEKIISHIKEKILKNDVINKILTAGCEYPEEEYKKTIKRILNRSNNEF